MTSSQHNIQCSICNQVATMLITLLHDDRTVSIYGRCTIHGTPVAEILEEQCDSMIKGA